MATWCSAFNKNNIMSTENSFEEHKDKALSQDAVSSCFCVVDEETGYYESIHKTLELAEKEITDWKRFKPSKDVIIVEREIH